MEAYKEWLRPKLVARMWYCGDEECDCTQPIIEVITPNTVAGYPWIRGKIVWSGEFLTLTYEYTAEERETLQYAPFREACKKYEVEWDE